MRISYLISCFDRPDVLPVVLWSLKNQKEADFEALVLDNSQDERIQESHRGHVEYLRDSRFVYHSVGMGDCYNSAEWGVERARGEFMCFPSDDSYYMPNFGNELLLAAEQNNWDLVYCDMVYDPRMTGGYHVLDVKPQACRIDKTGFILRRSKFEPWPGKLPQGVSGICHADGNLIHKLVHGGIAHGKVNQVLVVHN